MKMKMLLVSACAVSAFAGAPAHAATIVGSFSTLGFGGSFVGGSQTASTATGLDFGSAFGSTGNGFGTNGTALVGNALGSFAGLSGSIALITDLALGATANPFTSNPFISFGGGSNIVFNFSNATIARSPIGSSITVNGAGLFTDGVAADSTPGTFSLTMSSISGLASSQNFTYTGIFTAGAAVAAVPEPATWAMMLVGFGMLGATMRYRRRSTKVAIA